MKGKVVMDAAAVGQYHSEFMEFDLIGTVPKQGYIEYGFGGMIGYHHNVVEYFRASADIGKITLVFNALQPQAAIALHRLFSLLGRTVRRVTTMANREDGSRYAALEMEKVRLLSLSPVQVAAGTVYLIVFQTSSGNGSVKF